MIDFGRVLYLCDGRACGDECPNELCHHTMQWEHALHKGANIKNFASMPNPMTGRVDLVEPYDGE